MTRQTWIWLVIFLLPLTARGQQAGATGATTATASAPAAGAADLYGSGAENAPSLTDAGFIHNFLFFGAELSSRYDDNVRQTNGGRVADTGFAVSPEIAFRRGGGRMQLALRYRPTLLFYRHETAYNEEDHDFAFDGGFRATPRLNLRLRTDLVARSGLLQSVSGSPVLDRLGPPAHLNDSVVTPVADEFEDNSRADVTYALSPRAEAGVFTTYMLRSFGRPAHPASSAAPLNGTEGRSAGARYIYRASPRTTLGLVYVHEELHIGSRTRLGLDAPSAGLTLALSPRLTVNVYGGPVRTRLRDTLLVPYGPGITLAFPQNRSDWRWAAGGGVTLRAGRTAFRASVAHAVSDGGGLLDAVTSDRGEASLDRRLARGWTLESSAGWVRNASLPSSLLQGELDGEYGRILLWHPVSETVSAAMGYQFQRQRGNGLAPLGADFDRNFIYVTLTYRFKNIPLGR